jgi:MoaA/NifB/PqqE/SkfB family radical SAM enzyme
MPGKNERIDISRGPIAAQPVRVSPFREDFTTDCADCADGKEKKKFGKQNFLSVKSVKSVVPFLWLRPASGASAGGIPGASQERPRAARPPSSLRTKIGWKIYHFIHTTGWVADLVYWSAFYVQNAFRSLRYRFLARNGVNRGELHERRHLVPASMLYTGVTNICNAKCVFCAYSKVVSAKTLQTGIMPFETFKKAVDEWAAVGGRCVELTPVVGDPLVDPGLLDKIDYAVNKKGLHPLSLTTNGILLDRNDAWKKLIDLGVEAVFISTQGASREAYEKVYGVKKYDDYLSGLRHLLEYNQSRGEPARVVIHFRNAEKPSRIIRSHDFQNYIKPFLSEKVRVNFTVDFDNWGGTIQPEDLIGNMRMRVLPPRLDLPCRRLFLYAVRHDGGVRLCGCRFTKSDMDDLVVGNIQEKSLDEISRSDAAWNIIKGFYEGKRPETCRTCTVYDPIDRKWMDRRRTTDDSRPSAADPRNVPGNPASA